MSTHVYLMTMPSYLPSQQLLPKQRQAQIDSAKCERVKREKYYSWWLLQKLLKEEFCAEPTELNARLEACGRWVCDGYKMSISHAGGAVAAAVSDTCDIGIDIEEAKRQINPALARKIMTEAEASLYASTPDESKDSFLLSLWIKKEALFKARGESLFRGAELDTESAHTQLIKVTVGNADFVLAVAANEQAVIHIKDFA